MSKFVNYKKRSINLPAGCKDLIELLQPGKRPKAMELLATQPDVKVMRDDSYTSELSDVRKPIDAALESQAAMAMLTVASLDEEILLHIVRMGEKNLSTSVTFTQTPVNEQKMKTIFEGLGLQVPQDSEVPGNFIKGQPVQLIYEIDPERVQTGELAALATSIFREFCGTRPASRVQVIFLEFADAT